MGISRGSAGRVASYADSTGIAKPPTLSPDQERARQARSRWDPQRRSLFSEAHQVVEDGERRQGHGRRASRGSKLAVADGKFAAKVKLESEDMPEDCGSCSTRFERKKKTVFFGPTNCETCTRSTPIASIPAGAVAAALVLDATLSRHCGVEPTNRAATVITAASSISHSKKFAVIRFTRLSLRRVMCASLGSTCTSHAPRTPSARPRTSASPVARDALPTPSRARHLSVAAVVHDLAFS